ncbi:MAG: hypothetical protein MJE68_23235 [Proteobacteria bacterium]|nr:hypothetical protein [Pseudomonadota bacterium]
MARRSKKDSAADELITRGELESETKPLSNDIITMRWVMGLGFGTLVLVNSILIGVSIQLAQQNANENALLRQENIEIRAEHNELRLEFELHKAQHPPS